MVRLTSPVSALDEFSATELIPLSALPSLPCWKVLIHFTGIALLRVAYYCSVLAIKRTGFDDRRGCALTD
jgi:hypothetical protein